MEPHSSEPHSSEPASLPTSSAEPATPPAPPRDAGTPSTQDNVRDQPRPPVAGPNHRNLLLATALLVAVLGISLFLIPGRSPAPESRSAPSLPDRTYLDLPLPELPKPPEEPEHARWFEDPDQPPPPPRDWPREEPNAPAPAAEADPREEAFRRALLSATLRRTQPDARVTVADRELAALGAGSSLLPPADALEASLQAAQSALASFTEGGLPPLPGSLNAAAPGPSPSLGNAPGHASPGHASPWVAARYPAAGPRTLRAGTLIPARLETALDSDSPGPVTARVLRDVLDSTGRRVLIPAGAQLLGSLDSQLAYGANRVLLGFERLTWPAATYELPGLDALSLQGVRGLPGTVDHHFWPALGRATLLALVGSGVQLSQPARLSTEGLSPQQIVAAELGLEYGRVSQQILSRALDRRPTVRVPAGTRFVVYLNRDLIL